MSKNNLTEEIIENSEKINELISQKKYFELKNFLSKMNAVDLAEILADLDKQILPLVYRIIPKDLAAETFVEMDSEMQQTLLESFTDNEIKDIVSELFVDDTVDIIEEMPAAIVKRMLSLADAETRTTINKLLAYPQDSAGTIMTTEYVNLKCSDTVGDAFEKIRSTGIDKETIYTCYVTDSSRLLIGVVSARTLLLSAKDARISDIMQTEVIKVNTHDDKEFVAREISKYGFIAMPVVDNENRLVGIVTFDDALDVLKDENTEDFAKIAAIVPNEKPYLKTGVFRLYLGRLPWLLLLMISATVTSLIISKYENILLGISTVLFASIPMLMDSGGNAGSQASVTVIRELAIGQLEPKDALKVLFKELRIALLLGLSMGAVCFLKLVFLDRLYSSGPDGNILSIAQMAPIAAVVAVSLMTTIVIAKAIGSLLPLLVKRLKLDPAVVASPFITTLVDALSLIIYSNIALALLA